jgi:hypothetical protein
LGCESEQSHIPKLVAVEIPGTVSMAQVAAMLDEGAETGRWEYRKACCAIPSQHEASVARVIFRAALATFPSENLGTGSCEEIAFRPNNGIAVRQDL